MRRVHEIASSLWLLAMTRGRGLLAMTGIVAGLVCLVVSAGMPEVTLAAVDPISGQDCGTWGIKCTGADTPSNIINYIWVGVDVVLAFLATVAAAALVYFGILYIMSQGEEDRMKRAKTGIVYAILGMFVVGLAAWIVNSVLNL